MDGLQKALDDIIDAVAKSNGVILSKDDPVMILQTVHSLLLGQVHNAHTEQLRQFEAALQESLSVSSDLHKQQVAQLLNSGLSQANKLLQDQATTEGAALLMNAKQHLDEQCGRVSATAESLKMYAVINMIASGLAVIACIIAVTF